jgi:hypothetical protein
VFVEAPQDSLALRKRDRNLLKKVSSRISVAHVEELVVRKEDPAAALFFPAAANGVLTLLQIVPPMRLYMTPALEDARWRRRRGRID